MYLVDQVRQIRAAIVTMNTDLAMRLFTNLEHSLKREPICASDLSEIQSALNDILALAQSTCEGIASARLQMEKIISEAGRIEVYGETGEKISRELGGNIALKY